MSFWDLSDGDSAAKDVQTEYEIPGGGNFDPIPDGSTLLAMIDEAKWDEKDGAKFISLRWSVVAPDEFKNRKVFQKLWVDDFDPSVKDKDKAPKKRDRSRRMLATIDSNANQGGALVRQPGAPTDDSLTQFLCNKPMTIRVAIWSVQDRTTGETIEGNWVNAVGSKDNPTDIRPAAPRAAPKPSPMAASGASSSASIDDEIPF